MNMIRRRLMLAMAVLTVVAGAVQRAPAGVMLVTSPTALAPNDSIDWGQLGPDSTSLPSSTAVTSATGLVATVSTADPTGLLRVDEGLSWIGNFTVGDHLITNNQASYFPLTIGFASPVSGAGAQIQLDNAGPFTATITAFSGTNSLGTFTENGLSTALEDGSAIFIGVSDTKAEITSIVFGIDDPPAVSGDFAINSLLIRGVPEPSSLVLAAIAVPVGLGVWWRRRRQAARTRAE
jgi:PEP-CTERM motif